MFFNRSLAETSKRFTTLELEQKKKMIETLEEDKKVNPKNFSKQLLSKKSKKIKSLKTQEIKMNTTMKNKLIDKNKENNTIKEKKLKKGKKGKKGKKKKMNVETESNIIEKKPAYKRATTDIGLELLSNQEIKQTDTIKDTSNIKETEFSTNPK